MSNEVREVKEPVFDYASLGRQVRKAILDARNEDEHFNRLKTVIARHITNRTYMFGDGSLCITARKEEFSPYDMTHLSANPFSLNTAYTDRGRLANVAAAFGMMSVILRRNDEHTFSIVMVPKIDDK